MPLSYRSDLIPRKRAGAFALLESAGYNLSRLTPAQIRTIRDLFFLDDPRTVEQLIHDGEVQP
jgi:hypothetical protein